MQANTIGVFLFSFFTLRTAYWNLSSVSTRHWLGRVVNYRWNLRTVEKSNTTELLVHGTLKHVIQRKGIKLYEQ